jgi:hypothetical protein
VFTIIVWEKNIQNELKALIAKHVKHSKGTASKTFFSSSGMY